MAIGQPSALLQYLRRSVSNPRKAQGTDGDLLTAFVEHRDESAFDALVRRHGPMVFGVCNRMLASEHDAEDAFQATFLILVRKATSIMPRERVGNWLYGVAYNTALKARSVSLRRRNRARPMTEIQEHGTAPQRRDLWDDLKPLLDQELSRLPDKYRVPIVLCDLEGKARHEAAQQLGWPEGTLSGRLSRGRTLLAKRLRRRGLAISVGLMVEAFSQHAASASLPVSLASSTVKVAMVYGVGQTTVATISSPNVAVLVEGVLKAMLMRKFIIATAVFALGVSTLGTGVFVYRTQAAQKGDKDHKRQEGRAEPASQPGSPTDQGLNQSKPDESKVRHLQKERLALLKQIAADKQMYFKQGRIPGSEMLLATSAASMAELELCGSDQEKIAVLEKLFASAKEAEKASETLFENGRLVRSDLLAAKAARLEAEIELERVKAKAATKR